MADAPSHPKCFEREQSFTYEWVKHLHKLLFKSEHNYGVQIFVGSDW